MEIQSHNREIFNREVERLNNKKKLLILNFAFAYGGAEKSITDIISNLRDEYEIFFLIENEKFKKLLDEKNLNHKIFKIGQIKKNFITSIFKLGFVFLKLIIFILKFQPDVIITNTNRSHLLGSFASFITHTPLIWVLRDYQFDRFLHNLLYFFPNDIICVSKDLMKFYDSKDKHKVIPNGLEIHKLNNKFNLSYRKNYNINNEVVFGIASNFAEWKGIEYLIEGFIKTKNKIDNFNGKLFIAGTAEKGTKQWDYFINIKKMIKKSNFEEDIFLVGWVNDIYNFIYNCDVIVSSSIDEKGGPESFGRTIIEAWFLKKPVIVTNVGGPKYIVENKTDGIKVKQKSSRDLSKAIELLYKNEDQRKELGLNGYYKLKKEYSLNSITKEYRDIIKKLT